MILKEVLIFLYCFFTAMCVTILTEHIKKLFWTSMMLCANILGVFIKVPSFNKLAGHLFYVFSFFTIPQFSKKIKRKIKFFTVHLGGYFFTLLYEDIPLCTILYHFCTLLYHPFVQSCAVLRILLYHSFYIVMSISYKVVWGCFVWTLDFTWVVGCILSLTTRLNNKSFITR